jgi:hypothetical protein
MFYIMLATMAVAEAESGSDRNIKIAKQSQERGDPRAAPAGEAACFVFMNLAYHIRNT